MRKERAIGLAGLEIALYATVALVAVSRSLVKLDAVPGRGIDVHGHRDVIRARAAPSAGELRSAASLTMKRGMAHSATALTWIVRDWPGTNCTSPK